MVGSSFQMELCPNKLLLIAWRAPFGPRYGERQFYSSNNFNKFCWWKAIIYYLIYFNVAHSLLNYIIAANFFLNNSENKSNVNLLIFVGPVLRHWGGEIFFLCCRNSGELHMGPELPQVVPWTLDQFHTIWKGIRRRILFHLIKCKLNEESFYGLNLIFFNAR